MAHPEEEWLYVDDRVLKRAHNTHVCMTCQHFSYTCDNNCHTLLTCQLLRGLLPHGEHLTKRCNQWATRRAGEVGWTPEAG